MALDAFVKTNVTGKLTLADGTGTPVTLVVPFYGGDLTIAGIRKILNEVVKIEARGHRYGNGYGARIYPEINFSAFMSEFTNAAVGNLFDFLNNQGAYAANISADGGANRPYAVMLKFESEGTDFGGNDVNINMVKAVLTIDFAESTDGNKFTISGWCDALTGDITATGIA